MHDIRFDDLVRIYENTVFDAVGDEGTLTLSSPEIIHDLDVVEADEAAARDTGIALLDDVHAPLAVGQTVRIAATAPRLALGVLARNFDTLLTSPKARIEEPLSFFVIDGRMTRSTTPAPQILASYRLTLSLVALMSEAAIYVDPVRQEMMFFDGTKNMVPIRYDAQSLRGLPIRDASALLALFTDDVHRPQKLSILSETVIAVVKAQAEDRRFAYLLANIEALTKGVADGYKLFASNFSYSKIRRDVETAQFDYVGKVHKTFTDIQGQLLGIPVATVIVASQLRVAKDCGIEFWTDLAVVVGAWIFAGLVVIAIVNQWFTLDAIKGEVDHQKARFAEDYSTISERFADVFHPLETRIRWHRGGLVAVGLVSILGAGFASFAFHRLVATHPSTCVVGEASGMYRDRTPVTINRVIALADPHGRQRL